LLGSEWSLCTTYNNPQWSMEFAGSSVIPWLSVGCRWLSSWSHLKTSCSFGWLIFSTPGWVEPGQSDFPFSTFASSCQAQRFEFGLPSASFGDMILWMFEAMTPIQIINFWSGVSIAHGCSSLA
jgi:hypothetical protein